ncbi:hypothetical protein DSY14_24605 [Nocardiopsis sp. MG754419]|nr:hypothetical protein [Nocardiopsis sp. MG754419]
MVLGGVLVVILVVITAVSVLGNIVAHQSDRADSFGGATELHVDNRTGGRIEVDSTDGDEIVVERTLRGGPLSEPEERIDEGGDRLGIDSDCTGLALFSNCAIDYTILVPADVTVTLATVSGSVAVENLSTELSVGTTSGAVEVSDHTGPVVAETVSGAIELSDITGSADVSTTSGGIEVSGEGDRLEVSTTSGRVEVDDFTADEVVASSVSGSLELGGGFTTLEASTTSGSVEIATDSPFELMTVETVSGSVEAEVARGTYDVGGESTSGSRDIDVETSSDADSRIEVDTTSGSVRIR